MQNVELAMYLIAMIATTIVLWSLLSRTGKTPYALLALPIFGIIGAIFWFPPDAELQAIKQELPTIGREGFAGSDACRQCHVGHYESWHQSYHRTMTQVASEKSIQAPFDGRNLESRGSICRVDRKGDLFFVEMNDPDRNADEPVTQASRVSLPVVMTTGSHHLQAYWVPSVHGNKVRLFPWVYHIDSARWIPNGDSFLLPPEISCLPPDSKQFGQVWNNSCITCHSVAGDVGYEPGNWQSSVAELGISCEACHGPGAMHIANQQNPLTRYKQHLLGLPDPSIVNPARLSPHKSAEICGQCHVGLDDQVAIPHNQYRAGGDYQATFKLADSQNREDARFWGDGTMRVGGREFSGMLESECYRKGDITCISCHSMHSSDPDKQMKPEMNGNTGCLQCHKKFETDITQHTHHSAGSTGSLCYNCHMPYTSYALFTAIRSHRIDSPNVSNSQDSGKPVACNQCHVDQSLKWTSQHIENWYGTPQPKLDDEQNEVAASILWLLRGDAVQRTLAAWSLGWKASRDVAGDGWQVAFLAVELDDPYSIARYVAQKALKEFGVSIEGYSSLVSPDERSPVAPGIQETFPPINTLNMEGLRAVIDSNGLNRQSLEMLLKQRDNRPVTIHE